MRRVSIIFFLFIMVLEASAIPAYPYPIACSQPDGTTVLLHIRGDENFRYKTNMKGEVVARGVDGFFHPSEIPLSPQTKGGSGRKQPTGPLTDISTLVIPVQFSDLSFTIENTRSHFERMIKGSGYSEYGATGSVKEYFEDNLKGVVNVRFDVAAVVTLGKPLSYYGANNDNSRTDPIQYDVRIEEMFRDACRLADKDVNFSDYNYVYIFFAGYSEAEGGAEESIWPMSISLQDDPVVLDGSRIVNFSCSAELRGNSGEMPAGIGAFCHEFGHLLGFRDLYDVDYKENGQSKGLWGSLSLMDYGCYNNQGRTPPYLCAIELESLGVEPIQIGVGKYNLPPIQQKKFYKIITRNENEYFLFESRGNEKWDSHIGGEGMLVYHIDKSEESAGMITASVRWETNTVNTYALHECADLVEAVSDASNIKQVFFPGVENVTRFTVLTEPHFIDWNLISTGYKLTAIKQLSEGVSFNLEFDKDEYLLIPQNPKVRSYQTEAVVSWSANREDDVDWTFQWKKSDGSENFTNVTTRERSYRLSSLEPGERYTCNIFQRGERMSGDTLSFVFKTMDVTSPYPYIHGVKPMHNEGDTLKLKIFNLHEAYSSVKWILNGEESENGEFVLKGEGEQTLKVYLRYMSDNSEEVIQTKLKIGTRDEEGLH